jgi:hemoglobin
VPDVRLLCDDEGVDVSLYEFAGGEQAMLALARAHHARCLADPLLNHPFSHDDQHPEHVERLAAYWGEVLGGPPRYSDACGDETHVLWLHSETDAEAGYGENFLACFVAALDDAGLPDDPAFRAAMTAYMRWAVDNVMAYAPKGSQVPQGAPMPRFGWDGPKR